MYLNGGVNPSTNATIISPSQLNAITTGKSIMSASTADTSTVVYGAGWERLSVFGHDVSESCPLCPMSDITLAVSSSSTPELRQGSPRTSFLLLRMASGLSRSLMPTKKQTH